MEKKDFESAYRVACLGVTDADLAALASEALAALSTEVARQAYTRLRDIRGVELVARIEAGLKQARGGVACSEWRSVQ